MGRFVTPPKKERKRKPSSAIAEQTGSLEKTSRPVPSTSSFPHKTVAELKESLERTSLMVPSTSTSPPVFGFPHSTALTPGTLTPAQPPTFPTTEPDGSTIHSICLAQIVCKMARITVPPAIVLASAGFGLSAQQWDTVKGMRQRGEMAAFLKGGWRDVRGMGRRERWWEVALADCEERRVENLAWAAKVKEGMDGLRAM